MAAGSPIAISSSGLCTRSAWGWLGMTSAAIPAGSQMRASTWTMAMGAAVLACSCRLLIAPAQQQKTSMMLVHRPASPPALQDCGRYCTRLQLKPGQHCPQKFPAATWPFGTATTAWSCRLLMGGCRGLAIAVRWEGSCMQSRHGHKKSQLLLAPVWCLHSSTCSDRCGQTGRRLGRPAHEGLTLLSLLMAPAQEEGLCERTFHCMQ